MLQRIMNAGRVLKTASQLLGSDLHGRSEGVPTSRRSSSSYTLDGGGQLGEVRQEAPSQRSACSKRLAAAPRPQRDSAPPSPPPCTAPAPPTHLELRAVGRQRPQHAARQEGIVRRPGGVQPRELGAERQEEQQGQQQRERGDAKQRVQHGEAGVGVQRVLRWQGHEGKGWGAAAGDRRQASRGGHSGRPPALPAANAERASSPPTAAAAVLVSREQAAGRVCGHH